ncbi:CreA family protein [Sodalis sp.]
MLSLSRANTSGIKGGPGLTEDTSDAAISCQKAGSITLSDEIKSRPEYGV